MDALTRHSWFVAISSFSVFKDLSKKPINRIAMEVLIIALFFSFTVKMESYITFYIVQPLLKRPLGTTRAFAERLRNRRRTCGN